METWLVRSVCFVVSGCSDSSGIRTVEVSPSGDASFSFMAVMRTLGAWLLTVLNCAFAVIGMRARTMSIVMMIDFMDAKVRRQLGWIGKAGLRMGKL